MYKKEGHSTQISIRPEMTDLIKKYVDMMSQKPCSSDDLIKVISKKYSIKTINKEPEYERNKILNMIQCTVNFHTFIKNSIPIGTNIKVSCYGIEDVIDFIGRDDGETYIGLFDFEDKESDGSESYALQAAARAYNAVHDDPVNVMIYMYLMSGKSIMYTYDDNDAIETIAQILNSGAKVKRHGKMCKSCVSREKCIIMSS